MTDPSSTTRRRRGEAAMARIHGETGKEFAERLRSFAPDFADMLIDFPFGDIYARPGLDLKSRQFATIAALTVLSTAPRELQIHIRGALNVGATRQEIVELIMQMAVYGGFPAAIAGLNAARAAFEEVDSKA